jgi:hypothetical protein
MADRPSTLRAKWTTGTRSPTGYRLRFHQNPIYDKQFYADFQELPPVGGDGLEPPTSCL